MAYLSTGQMDELIADFQRDISAVRTECAVTRSDLRATLVALDEYLDDNAATINQTIPVGPRAALSNQLKAQCMAYVALKRYGVI